MANLKEFFNKISNNNRIYTREDIGNMSSDEFRTNEKAIDYQLANLGIPAKSDLALSDDVVYVHSYTRDDGTKVKAHYRSKAGHITGAASNIENKMTAGEKMLDILGQIVSSNKQILNKNIGIFPIAGANLQNARQDFKYAKKNDNAHIKLSEQIKTHSFTREYEAVAVGSFKKTEGTIDAPIGRHHTDRKKMCVTQQNSKNAVTHYSVIKQYGGFAHLKLKLETGRTHQIRVHLSYIGHPVLGDDVYGKAYKGLDGQCLHARKIGFIHPSTNEYMEFESPLPDYFESILRKIGKM